MSVARLVDVMPTVLDLFDIPIAKTDGVSLVKLEAEPATSSREVYAEAMYPLRFGWAQLRSLRADRFKFIEAPRPELSEPRCRPFGAAKYRGGVSEGG